MDEDMDDEYADKWGVRYYAPDQPDADEMGSVTDYLDSRAAAELLAEGIIAPNYGPELVIIPPQNPTRRPTPRGSNKTACNDAGLVPVAPPAADDAGHDSPDVSSRIREVLDDQHLGQGPERQAGKAKHRHSYRSPPGPNRDGGDGPSRD